MPSEEAQVMGLQHLRNLGDFLEVVDPQPRALPSS